VVAQAAQDDPCLAIYCYSCPFSPVFDDPVALITILRIKIGLFPEDDIQLRENASHCLFIMINMGAGSFAAAHPFPTPEFSIPETENS